MSLALATFTVMSGNSVKTTGIATMREPLQMAVPGEIVMKMMIVLMFVAGALGSTFRGIAAPLLASTTSSSTMTRGSALRVPCRGRSALHFYPLSLFRFFREIIYMSFVYHIDTT
jgi:hypothetical protein